MELLSKLLSLHGKKAAEAMARRSMCGNDLVVKGVKFPPDVLKEVVGQWKLRHQGAVADASRDVLCAAAPGSNARASAEWQ